MMEATLSAELRWWKVAEDTSILEKERLHTCIEGRYVTIFRNNGKLSVLDSVCHHAGGPLTIGPLQDIEDLGRTTVSCPWHHFLVCIDTGLKVYKGVDIVDGKPIESGWKVGKLVQRAHRVVESMGFIFVALDMSNESKCSSDADAKSQLCGQQFTLHSLVPEPATLSG